jgi:hypothetical protein
MATAATSFPKASSTAVFHFAVRVNASTLPSRLRSTLTYMLRFNRFGTELWPATKAVAVEAGISYRTARRHIDRLVEMKVLKEMYPSNCLVRHGGGVKFRRSATYQLDSNVLVSRPTYKEFRASQAPAKPFGPQRVSAPPPSPTPAQAPKPPQSVSVGVPESPQKTAKLRLLTSRERANLVQALTNLMRGHTQHIGIDHLAVDLSPGDPRYVAPMDSKQALLAACKALLIPIESAIEALKLAGFKVESEGDA